MHIVYITMSTTTDDGPNTRPSSPRSNASTPRGDPDLSALRSLPGTPRPNTQEQGGNRKSKHRKCKPCKNLRRKTKRIIRKRIKYY